MTVTIDGARVAFYHLPREVWWEVPIADHTLAIDAIDLVTCELSADDGTTGMGYTYTLSHGGGAVARLLADDVASHLVGRTVDRPEPVWAEAWNRTVRYGRGGVASVGLAAADVAVWDLLSRSARLPLYRYIGAHRDSIPVYGSSIDLGYDLGGLLATVREWKDRGFGAVKIKVGRPLHEDLDRLTAVRELLGDDIELMVDANNGWMLPEASVRIEAMSPFGLVWVEEPLHADDVSGHEALQRGTSTPIAAGETLFSVADFRRYFEKDALRYVQADVGRVGGITPWLEVARLAAAYGLPMAPHFLHDLHVHLICAVPNAHRLEYLPLLDAIMADPLEVVDGWASPPARPGHGIRFVQERLDPHLVMSEAWGSLSRQEIAHA